MLSMKDSMGYSFFLCNKCEKVHKKTWQTVNLLSKRVESIEKRMDELEKSFKDNLDEMAKTNSKMKQVEDKTCTSSDNVKTSVLSEIQEQKNRKNNIVIYNLAECASEDATERNSHDKTQFNQLLQTIGLSDDANDQIATIRRLGQRSNTSDTVPQDINAPVNSESPIDTHTQEPEQLQLKPRPLLVSFKVNQPRKDILFNAKKLANTNLKHVSICPDLTKAQQIEDRLLREEVKKLNIEHPVDDKGSFLWKVVGQPGQPSRRKVKIYQQEVNLPR